VSPFKAIPALQPREEAAAVFMTAPSAAFLLSDPTAFE
jgi:hypothetical protein